MTGKSLFRSIRRRCDAAFVWAMMPVALLCGRNVSGCLSQTGRFDPDCHCAAMQKADENCSATVEAKTCHKACCQGKCCCCKSKAGCSENVAVKERQSKHDGFQTGGHCRPFSVFVGVTIINSAGQSWDVDQSTAALPVALNTWLPTVQHLSFEAVERDTGPPPDNLVVALHRWII